MHFSKVTERGPKKETWHVFPGQDEFPLHTTSGPVPRFYLPGEPRSIRLEIAREDLPDLE